MPPGDATRKDDAAACSGAASAGLAGAYLHMAVHQLLPAEDAYARARLAAGNAVARNPDVAEAHAALAHVQLYADWDWAGAERSYRRAIELSPSLPEPHQGYSWWLAYQGRGGEAVSEAEQAWQLDPLSPTAITFLTYALLWSRRYDQTVEHCEHGLAIDANSPFLHQVLGLALLQTGETERGCAHLDRAVELLPGHPMLAGCRGYAHAVRGDRDTAAAIRSALESVTRSLDASAEAIGMAHAAVAMVCAGTGELEKALDALEAAYALHSPWVLALTAYPSYDPLRRDPRFAPLASRIGLHYAQQDGATVPAGMPVPLAAPLDQHQPPLPG